MIFSSSVSPVHIAVSRHKRLAATHIPPRFARRLGLVPNVLHDQPVGFLYVARRRRGAKIRNLLLLQTRRNWPVPAGSQPRARGHPGATSRCLSRSGPCVRKSSAAWQAESKSSTMNLRSGTPYRKRESSNNLAAWREPCHDAVRELASADRVATHRERIHRPELADALAASHVDLLTMPCAKGRAPGVLPRRGGGPVHPARIG